MNPLQGSPLPMAQTKEVKWTARLLVAFACGVAVGAFFALSYAQRYDFHVSGSVVYRFDRLTGSAALGTLGGAGWRPVPATNKMWVPGG
jgi:hypothetical protein